ncbi:MAG TPA: phospho-sugar mutase, partial [Acidimicrobiales bacterium]|nr:phospho-sugar mutase [Acidimicrobiales bacterium]
IRQQVLAWIDDDPDPVTAAELSGLLGQSVSSPEAAGEIEDRFADRLHFGTAGLRGAVAAGPNRMNVAVVRRTTAALAAWLLDREPAVREAGVALGCDARHGSAAFYDEVARVLSGAGILVHALPPQQPTPLLAFAVRHLDCAAGVMITASHNPPADNGYKLYGHDGAQIVPPTDAEIEALMGSIDRLAAVATGDLYGPLVVRHGDEIAEAYLRALAAVSPAPPGGDTLQVVYTPMHGVAGSMFGRALALAGFGVPVVVPAQAAPDPDFPTVSFPNPEEAGALDLAFAEARRVRADVVIANDPDGDRLAVAVPDPSVDGGWLQLTGDQLGCLIGSYVLERDSRPDGRLRPLVVTTIVSSTLLADIAAAAGASFDETLTGFKWIVRGGGNAEARFVFGYEEALGYAVGTVVRDKDGLGAALAFLGLLATERASGRSVLDRLDDLETSHGVHLTAQTSIRTDDTGTTMSRLRAAAADGSPRTWGGSAVLEIRDLSAGSERLPASDVLVYRLDGGRVVVRPSGTEPKLKAYFEIVEQLGGAGLGAARIRASARMSLLRAEVDSVLGSP